MLSAIDQMNWLTQMTYIDSHAHLTADEVYPNIVEILERARGVGVSRIVNICTDSKTLERGFDLVQRCPWIFNAAAVTPHDVEKEGDAEFSFIASAARAGKLVAIGETGLDYFYHHSKPEIQLRFLRAYLQLALECHLPVIIHCREAFADFFRILDSEYGFSQRSTPGVVHCFTGSLAEAEEVLKRDWLISLSGIVTFKKSFALQEVAKMVPLDRMLIETDTPYLAPQSHRGKSNEPSFILETAKLIADLKGISIDQVAEITSANAMRLFCVR